MKELCSLIMAAGLGLALSVGAQTATDEQQQQPQPPQQQPQQPAQGQGTTTAEPNANTRPARASQQTVQSNERERAPTNVDENVNRPRGDRANRDMRMRTDERRGESRIGAEGTVSHATTVFRNGHETRENLALHRGVRDRADVHFRIGTHPRVWWLQTYSIVLIDSCHYYLADDGCWYPAYGFDPSCDFPEGVVYCD
jgi:hypothetical protein